MTRSLLEIGDAPDHPVLAEPWTYSVTGLRIVYAPGAPTKDTLYLTLARVDERVCLRFTGIQELKIDAGFPHFQTGLQILDISRNKWEGITIRVIGLDEASPDMRFYARDVAIVTDETDLTADIG